MESARNPWPKHHRVYLVLRQQIQEGVYSSDAALPNEFELSDQFAVSRITIRRAMRRLEEENLIQRYRGRGTFALATEQRSWVQASISGDIENLVSMGRKTSVKVLAFQYVTSSPEVAAALALPAGEVVQKALRIRSYQGRPFSHLVTYVPEEVGRSYSRADLASQPLLVLLERAGVLIERAQQAVTARLATPEEANLLAIEPGEPLLCIRRIVFEKSGRPVEFICGLYRPDVYEHETVYSRTRRGGKQVWTSERSGTFGG